MPTRVLMPQLGESVNEGTVSKWLKAEGEQVNEFDPLLEINTDKVDTEIPSPGSGVLLKILAAEGQTVQVGTLLALIGEPDEAGGDGGRETAPEAVATRSGNGGAAKSEATTAQPTAEPAPGRDRVLGFISPVVAKIAREQQVDLTQVAGTGQSGRITKKDILDYLEQRQSPASAPAAPVSTAASTPAEATAPVAPPAPKPAAPKAASPAAPSTGPAYTPPEVLPGEVVPLNAVRRAIAEHMVYSKHTSPHVTTVMEADLSRIAAHREANKGQFARDGANLTFTAYFVAATVAALKAFPLVNSSWSEEGIVVHKEISVGMATSLGEAGLIVPVIKNADGLSLLGIARAVNDLANRARARQLKPDEVKGGTFTITNHGTSGSLFATPVINQPQCGILGVGAIQKRVVVINDAIAIRPMAYLSLTFDHRILDGAIADFFLGKVVEYLQNWTGENK